MEDPLSTVVLNSAPLEALEKMAIGSGPESPDPYDSGQGMSPPEDQMISDSGTTAIADHLGLGKLGLHDNVHDNVGYDTGTDSMTDSMEFFNLVPDIETTEDSLDLPLEPIIAQLEAYLNNEIALKAGVLPDPFAASGGRAAASPLAGSSTSQPTFPAPLDIPPVLPLSVPVGPVMKNRVPGSIASSMFPMSTEMNGITTATPQPLVTSTSQSVGGKISWPEVPMISSGESSANSISVPSPTSYGINLGSSFGSKNLYPDLDLTTIGAACIAQPPRPSSVVPVVPSSPPEIAVTSEPTSPTLALSICPMHNCVHRRFSSNMSNEILTAVSNGEPFSKGPRKGKAPAAGGSKRTSTSLPAQKTKRNHEKFTPLPDIPACNFAEAFTAVRQSPAWSAAVEHAEDPSRGGCGCQFQISNTNKVFTGMYKLVGPRCYRKYTFKEGYQPQIVRWDDGDSCWIMAQPVDGTMTTYFQSRCNDDRMPLDTWEAVHDAAGQPPTIEVLIGNSKKSSEMCSSCKVRESYHTVYYGPQENTKPACDGGSGTAPEVGMKGQRQKHSDFCEACGLSVSNHTVYHGSKINGGGIGLAIFKLFPPCHARKNWRLSVNREVCLDAPVPMETERTAAPSQSSRRKRGPDSLSGDEQQIFNALASLVERRGFDFVRHAVNSLEGNGPPSSKRVKVEVGAEEVGPREEGSIIVRFVAPLSADGWWPMSSFERWIEQAGSASITEAASVKLQYAVASISSKTGGDLSTAKLNLKLKFDANFRDTTHHAKIDTLNIPAQLQSWLDRAGETFKFHEKAVKAFTSVFRSKVGKIRLGELLLDAAKVVFPNSRFPSEVYFAAPEARRKQSNPPSYDEITSSEPPPAYVPLSIAQPPETSAEMLETTAEQHHSSTVDVIDEDPSALSDTATSSTADGDDTSPASFDNAELGFGLSPQQEAHDGEDDIEWLLEEEARRATAQQQQGRSHPRRSPRKRVPAS